MAFTKYLVESNTAYFPENFWERRMVIESTGKIWLLYAKYVASLTYNLILEYSTDNGETWTSFGTVAQVVGDELASFRTPSIAIDSDDTIYIVYGHYNENVHRACIYYKTKDVNGNLSNAQQISDPFDSAPQNPISVLITSNDTVHIFSYVLLGEGDTYVHNRLINGIEQGWSVIVQQSISLYYYAVASFQNNVYMAYIEQEDNNYYLRFKEWTGSWGSASTLENFGDTFTLNSFSLSADDSGNLYLAIVGAPDTNLYSYRKPSGGSWGTKVTVDSSGTIESPALTNGTIYLLGAKAINGDYEIVYFSYNGSWSESIEIIHDSGKLYYSPYGIYSLNKIYLSFYNYIS